MWPYESGVQGRAPKSLTDLEFFFFLVSDKHNEGELRCVRVTYLMCIRRFIVCVRFSRDERTCTDQWRRGAREFVLIAFNEGN